MPAPTPTLTLADVDRFVAAHVFGPSADPDGLGVELEWLTSQGRRDRRLPVTEATRLIDRLSPLPAGSLLTLEPGGQLELSSAPFRSIDEVCAAATSDLALLDAACDASQVELIALGADPLRPPERVAVASRYQAMEHYFDQLGSAGRTMMCNTAAIQVNVGLGEPDQVAARWRLANQLGPTLIACFANSPFAGGLPSGWQSSRLRAWWALDPTRSAPVPLRRRSVVGLGALRARRPRHAHPSRRRPVPPDERALELRRLARATATSSGGRPRTTCGTTSRRCSRRCARRGGSSCACSTRCPRPCGRWRWPSRARR